MAIGVIRIVSTRNVNGLFMRTNVKVVVKGIHHECQTPIFIFNQHKFLYFTIQTRTWGLKRKGSDRVQ